MKAERTYKSKFSTGGITLRVLAFLAMAIGAGAARAESVTNAYAVIEGENLSRLPVEEEAEVKRFISDFATALRMNDEGVVKEMSGESWSHWEVAMKLPGRYESIEVVNVGANTTTNVAAKIHWVRASGVPETNEAIFFLKKEDGVYSIAKLDLPESRNKNDEISVAYQTVRKLAAAINNRKMSEVKGLVTFGDADDFELELVRRGLSWVKESIARGDKVKWPGVSRGSREVLIGEVECASPAQTNSVKKFVFKGSKIDRAAPVDDSVDERARRFMEEVFKSSAK